MQEDGGVCNTWLMVGVGDGAVGAAGSAPLGSAADGGMSGDGGS